MKIEIGLGLGSNLGDRLENLREARRRILALAGVRPVAVAPVYETEPVGVRPEHRLLKFLNTVLVIEADREAESVHGDIERIEAELGRVRSEDRFAPRLIDIDVLYAGGARSDTPSLTLPHPRWARRRFVVQPLADVRPDLVLPGTERSVRETLSSLPPGESVALFRADW